MSAHSTDKVRTLIARHLRDCLHDLKNETPRPEGALLDLGGWTGLVLVFPTPEPGIPGLTECDLDCLRLLGQVNEPLSAVRVRTELEKRKIAIWGIATVKRSLAKLKHEGLIYNSRTELRGYFLPDALPLERVLSHQDT